jgi:hypothetical protein
MLPASAGMIHEPNSQLVKDIGFAIDAIMPATPYKID